MHQTALAVILGHVIIQPVDQRIHCRNMFGFRGAILFAPAVHLPAVIIALGSVIGQPCCHQINVVDGGKHAVGFTNNLAARLGGKISHERRFEIAPVNFVHDIERRPNDAWILAEHMHFRHGHIAARQCLLHLEFALYCMGRFQQHARRLAAQNKGLLRRDQPKCWV